MTSSGAFQPRPFCFSVIFILRKVLQIKTNFSLVTHREMCPCLQLGHWDLSQQDGNEMKMKLQLPKQSWDHSRRKLGDTRVTLIQTEKQKLNQLAAWQSILQVFTEKHFYQTQKVQSWTQSATVWRNPSFRFHILLWSSYFYVNIQSKLLYVKDFNRADHNSLRTGFSLENEVI